MKGKRYSEEQIIRILDEAEAGKPVAEMCRAYSVAEATIYRWRRRYRGMDEAHLRQAGRAEQAGCLTSALARTQSHRCRRLASVCRESRIGAGQSSADRLLHPLR